MIWRCVELTRWIDREHGPTLTDMDTSNTRQYERILDLAVMIIERFGHEPPWQFVCPEIMAVLDSSFGGYFDIRLPTGTAECIAWPRWDTVVPMSPAQLLGHPLVRHWVTHSDLQPRFLDEVLYGQRWQTARSHAAARAHFDGATHQVGIPIPHLPGKFRAVGLGRTDRFSAGEREFIRRIQPLLVAADRHYRILSRWQQSITPRTATAAQSATAYRITAREIGVLALLAKGWTAHQIARTLGISTHTAIKHKSNLYRKLGTSDRLTTVVVAQRIGLLGDVPGEEAGFRVRSEVI